MKLIFMGTPDFSKLALQALVDAGHEIACVYSQPPRPKGRGLEVQKQPVHVLADELGIDVRTPQSLKSTEEQQRFVALKADAAVVVAYGLLLPKPILDAPKFGCFNIHASLLPRWRGAAPIQRAIMAGDAQEIQAKGIIATVLQHEIDHLNGVLFIDHISRLKRQRVIKKFQKADKLGKL